MIKRLVLLLAFFTLINISHATVYQTIDVAGVIKWSTDGGVTDCGCQASDAGKKDSIAVNHSYTFPIGYFGSDDEIEAPTSVNAGLSNLVVFEDDITLFKIAMSVSSSDVTFNGAFDITGAGQNVSGILAHQGSVVRFNGNFGGTKNQDNSILYLEGSAVVFATGIDISKMVLVTAVASNVTLNANIDVLDSYLINTDNSALSIGNSVRFEHCEVFLYSNNVTIGVDVKFDDATVVGFGENMNISIPSSTKVTNSTLNLFSPDLSSGAIVNFESGVEIVDCEIHITSGSIANFTDPYITTGANSNSVISVDGLLNLDSAIIITYTDFSIQSNGVINLQDGTSCDFTASTVNGRTNNAGSVLICGDAYNPDDNEFNIWENGVWSQVLPPNHVGALVEIRDEYETSIGGDILCGNLFIEEEIGTTISTGDYIRATQSFNNLGTMTIENSGSLIMDENTYFHNENGYFKVEREGQLSSMNYNVWSSPIVDINLLDMFNEANPCDIFAFEAKSQVWKYDYLVGTEVVCDNNPDTIVFGPSQVISGADGKMDIGRGYFVPGNDVSAVRSFDGMINNGPITKTVKTTDLGQNPYWSGDDWNLLGNPYPSALDLNLFWGRNAIQQTYLTDAIYFWVETVNPPYDEIGSYEAWNPLGGTYFYSSNGEVNGINGTVPAGMGFWVLANDPNDDGTKSYNVLFDNTMRDVNQVQLSKSRFYTYSTSERQRMWLNLTNDSNQYDQVLIGTHPEATDSIDVLFDAHVNYGGEPIVLATVHQQEYFTIDAYAPRIKVDTTEIELLVVAANESNHYLEIDSSLFYLDEKRIYLLDKKKGTEQEMLLKQQVLLDIDTAGRYDQRFYLKVTNSHITNVQELDNGLDGRIWSYGNEVFYDSFVQNIAQIQVYDLRGVEVYISNPNNRNSSFTLSSITEGIYIVKLTDDFGNERVERLFIK